MALHIHRAERADALAAALAAVLADPLPDPFAQELVAVPAKGVERWLAQQLSAVLGCTPGGRDGIAANIRFPAPAALVDEVLAQATGIDPQSDPWAHDRVVWTLLRVIDESLGEPWCAVLAQHLGPAANPSGDSRTGDPGPAAGDPEGGLGDAGFPTAGAEHRLGRRYATAARLAALFEGYALQRPRLITEWAAGADTDGTGRQLPGDLAWQPVLWRRLRAAIGTPGPAERLHTACARLRDEPNTVTLPDRLSVFGATRLPAAQLAVLSALAEHRDLHLWLTHPSPALWAAPDPSRTGDEADGRADRGFRETAALPATPPGSGPPLPAEISRAEDDSAARVRHPLLAASSRDIRELQLRLPVPATDTRYPALPGAIRPRPEMLPGPAAIGEKPSAAPGPAGSGVGSEPEPATLLQAVQAHIRDDEWPPVPGRRHGDGSVQIHACHGPVRQVEVLRECLLGLFAADPTLEPRDVVIMCPEVEAFAPLVRAAFGQPAADTAEAAVHPGHRLRVRLADRGRGATNPLLGLVAQLLELARGRVTVTEVLDLAAAEPVRRACGFDDDDIERMREWAVEAGARWGIGRRQRQAFGLGDFEQNTLNAALDRILLGVTADESSQAWLDRVLPLGDVDSNDIDLAGRFAEYVDRLAAILRDLQGPAPAAQWSAILGRALDLLTDMPESQAWIRTEARRELAAATAYAGDTVLRLPDITELLQSRSAATPTRANFRTGELTVCTLTPMRSVPHRVVVLLGVDDEVFPRGAGIDGDDVTARDPLVGERDPRSEDRQLLLDAIMAARDTLVVLHTGADPVTGAYRPPAVPVAELLDTLRAHVGPDGMGAVLTRHPLQPHDRRNFAPPAPFGFDPEAFAGARATLRTPESVPGPLARVLPAAETTETGLAELIAFLEHPIRGFLWQRLGVRIPEPEEEITDRLPIEFGGLDTWALGERMLTARLAGADPAALRAAEWRRGTLPPAELGRAVLDDVERTVETLVRAAAPDYTQPPRDIDITLDLGGGRRLTGTVAEVRGDLLVRTTFSRVAPKHRLAAWVSLLALAATEDRQWRAAVTGRGRFPTPAWRAELTAPPAAEAGALLRTLVALREAGLNEPLPIPTATTAAYAEARFRRLPPEEAMVAADRAFAGGDRTRDFAEHTDRNLRYIWGPAPDLSRLAAAPAPAGEPVEQTRFGSIARRLWAPLLRAEQQGAP
ncbi:exodeoxyribonuclease V subunit gamma [Nocardia carnea]|uniref:exodeoxyribonuclease V subunit gamma n=1 Tax=Nocardia carnea TaxID=37328 RepID=UPI002456EA61|nr:exodeoxyribonuclease V subunit gamma [Nocardia carnea]